MTFVDHICSFRSVSPPGHLHSTFLSNENVPLLAPVGRGYGYVSDTFYILAFVFRTFVNAILQFSTFHPFLTLSVPAPKGTSGSIYCTQGRGGGPRRAYWNFWRSKFYCKNVSWKHWTCCISLLKVSLVSICLTVWTICCNWKLVTKCIT
jgi:hypothetical protein